jgi:polysaccharide export outer membrane protein
MPAKHFDRLAPDRMALVSVWAALLLATAGVFAAEASEVIGPGDTVRISVFQNPDLTIETRVSQRGTITFPLLGEVRLAGLTPSQAETLIARNLKEGKLVLNPQVNVSVTQLRSRQVSVLGQVVKPGRYPLDEASVRLTDILAMAGGVTPTGSDTVTVITERDGKPQKIDVDIPGMFRSGDLSRNLGIASGDTIFVQRAPVFYIYGEVQHAGSYRIEANMTLMQALALGGGLTLRGTQSGLRVHRRDAKGEIQTLEPALTDPVLADDVIYVKESLL